MAGQQMKKYVLGRNKLLRGFADGVTITDDGHILTEGDDSRRMLFLEKLDCIQEGTAWGRLSFQMKTEGDIVPIVHAFASNDDHLIWEHQDMEIDSFLLDPAYTAQDKGSVFTANDGERIAGAADVLLYAQKGRYLWLWFDFAGSGSAELWDIHVVMPGDNFFTSFPEIYTRNNEFLHRWMSVFSSMYDDFQGKIDEIPKYLDPVTAPREMLEVFAGWLGIDLGGNFMEEAQLRRLVLEAPFLLKAKGTRTALQRLIAIFVEEPVFIVEKNLLPASQTKEEERQRRTLYGDSPYAFIVLIRRKADEKLRSRLLFMINQFKPVRATVGIVFLDEGGSMDYYSYMDVNSTITENREGYIDDSDSAMTGRMYLL